MIGWIILVLVVGMMAYIRLSPTDVARFHKPITATADEVRAGGAVRVIPGDGETFARLEADLGALPRTHRFAGSSEEGLVTYVTRSLVFGFPDYTTLQLVDGQIRMFARLRFGNSDLGVNAARLEGLISRLKG